MIRSHPSHSGFLFREILVAAQYLAWSGGRCAFIVPISASKALDKTPRNSGHARFNAPTPRSLLKAILVMLGELKNLPPSTSPLQCWCLIAFILGNVFFQEGSKLIRGAKRAGSTLKRGVKRGFRKYGLASRSLDPNAKCLKMTASPPPEALDKTLGVSDTPNSTLTRGV